MNEMNFFQVQLNDMLKKSTDNEWKVEEWVLESFEAQFQNTCRRPWPAAAEQW
jgi:hypothetical protein